MGYELNKLMRQFGVSSPTAPIYTGTTDQDRANYGAYTQDYRNRIAAVPMYNQPQFQTTLNPTVAPKQIDSPFISAQQAQNIFSNLPREHNGSVAEYMRDGFLSSQEMSELRNLYGVSAPGGQQVITNTLKQYDPQGYWAKQVDFGSVQPTTTVQPAVNTVIPTVDLNTKTDYSTYYPSSNINRMDNLNVQLRSHGGEVKKFAVGGLNDLATDYGLDTEDNYGISMLPGSDVYQYGPRPKEGPLGAWFEEVAKETVPGVRVAGRARTPERNREVGGVKDSYHLTDNARDFTPPKGMTVGELGDKLKSELGAGFDVIYNTKGHFDHVHVEPGPNLGSAPKPKVAEALSVETAPAEETASAATAAPKSSRFEELQTMLGEFGPGESVYAGELKAARAKASEEADAFKNMLEASLTSPEDAKASKAEMYFRLAAAFGSPTKTGGFGENLGLASKEMAEFAKGKRESSQNKLATRLKLQEMRMGAAKEELSTLRALAGEEMKDRRAMAQSLIKDYIESGKPQSSAGKQALDEGLVAGTPAFQARVRELALLDVQRESAQIQALVANLKLSERREQREERKEKREEDKANKLTPQELTLKRDTEDSLASINSAMSEVSKAYRLNPNTFGGSLIDMGRRKALELSGSNDPKLINTRTLENLLKSQAITSAAEKLKGVLSDSDIKLIMSIAGLDANSPEERANILREAYIKLQAGQKRLQQRLQDVSSGAYRQVSGD